MTPLADAFDEAQERMHARRLPIVAPGRLSGKQQRLIVTWGEDTIAHDPYPDLVAELEAAGIPASAAITILEDH